MDEVSLPPKISSSPISLARSIDELLKNLESYYGYEYNDTQRKIIKAYLLELDPFKYSRIYGNVIRVKLYAARLPLVEHFEEAASKIVDEYVEPIYRKMDGAIELAQLTEDERARIDAAFARLKLKWTIKQAWPGA